jgi:uncharacterized ubiquitin-like protein YukD
MAQETINVQVVDQAGGKQVVAEMPYEVPISRLIGPLVSKLELPDGPDNVYQLMHKSSGKILDDSDTLKDAGVKDGDTLRLLPNAVAGLV